MVIETVTLPVFVCGFFQSAILCILLSAHYDLERHQYKHKISINAKICSADLHTLRTEWSISNINNDETENCFDIKIVLAFITFKTSCAIVEK